MAQEGIALKKSFKISQTIENIYGGGEVVIGADEEHIYATCGEDIKVFNLQTGTLKFTLKGDTEPVTSIAVKPDGTQLINGSRSLHLRIWDLTTGTCTRNFRGHDSPVLSLSYEDNEGLVCSGAGEGNVRVWDTVNGYCTHNFKGHNRPVTFVRFHPNTTLGLLFSASEDTQIRIWNLNSKSCQAILEGHVSPITSLSFSNDGSFLYSGGRDKVVNIWDIKTKKLKQTIPVYETVETIHVLPNDSMFPGKPTSKKTPTYFVTGGDKCILRIWNSETKDCVYEQTLEKNAHQSIVNSLFCPKSNLIGVVTIDQTILFYNLETFERVKQIVGMNDEVIDVQFVGDNNSHLAVASNTETLRVYNLQNLDCQVYFGHTDVIICMDSNKDGSVLATGSKDRQARIWKIDSTTGIFHCVGICAGHAESIGGIALSRKGNNFMISGSEDKTIKYWETPFLSKTKSQKEEPHSVTVKYTKIAHEKDINSIAVSPNDRLFVTGSQDKTAKLWNSLDGQQMGVFKGHKRGIWSVAFSTVDQVVATSSADKTIKIWSITDFTCLRTFEGHTNSVLKVNFVTAGMQLISAGSDGLLKLWNIKNSECVNTFDAHEDKVWGLAVNKTEDLIATGGGDSNVKIWNDVTKIEEEEAEEKEKGFILREQELSNYLYKKDYKNAILLCLELDQPRRLFKILSDVIETQMSGNKDSITGSKEIDSILVSLNEERIEKVLGYIKEWNTNNKFTRVAQNVLQLILTSIGSTDLLKLKSTKKVLEALIPYTEKHFSRVNQLMTNSFIVDHTLQSMDIFLNSLPEDSESHLPQYTSVQTHSLSNGIKDTENEIENGKDDEEMIEESENKQENGINSEDVEEEKLNEVEDENEVKEEKEEEDEEVEKIEKKQKKIQKKRKSEGISEVKTKKVKKVEEKKKQSKDQIKTKKQKTKKIEE